jgi:hypothetical protein
MRVAVMDTPILLGYHDRGGGREQSWSEERHSAHNREGRAVPRVARRPLLLKLISRFPNFRPTFEIVLTVQMLTPLLGPGGRNGSCYRPWWGPSFL